MSPTSRALREAAAQHAEQCRKAAANILSDLGVDDNDRFADARRYLRRARELDRLAREVQP